MSERGTKFAIEHKRHEQAYTMPNKHEHNHYEIYYLIAGERVYFIEDQIFRVHQGDLVFISKGLIHRTSEGKSSTGVHERVVVYFTEEFINSLLPPPKTTELLECFNSDIKVVHLDIKQQNFIENLLQKMRQEFSSSKIHLELYQQMLLVELLIFSNRLKFKANNDFLSDHNLNPVYHTVYKILRHIRTNYQEQLTLSGIAEEFYISQYYLSRVFRQVTGVTLVEYINNTRIKAAQRMLVETDKSVNEIAAETGYESQTHFGRMFKKISGTSPLKYRKQNKQT